ncbi:MAG: DNA-formamidopyrimidine glycosylase family protein [Anaerolineales bacterium]
MPELPDVEVFRRYFQSTSLHQTITGVKVCSQRILEDTSEGDLRRLLIGHTFLGTDRHGKYLFLDVEDKGWMGLHFGMTGHLAYYKGDGKAPEYTRAKYDFKGDYHLALVMPRKLGSIFIAERMQDFVKKKALGPDVYKESFDKRTFLELISNRRGMVKSQLMNQQLMAGIGNVYSDEVLFQAKIHPRKQLGALTEDEKGRIYRTMQEVLETSIERQADPNRFPDGYLTPHREKGGTCPRCGHEIKKVKVSGRSSYFCPQCQG